MQTAHAFYTVPMKIWIVDDEPEICHSLAYVLRKKNFEVHTFNSPLHAVDNLRDPPECIICDFKMPHMDGREFFLRIKQGWQGIFLLLTGELDADITELKSLGIKEVLFKPNDLSRILSIVENLPRNK
jgi:DNA-binding response OmpR family regulator